MNKFERKLKDIPELVEKLRDERKRQRDYLADQKDINMQAVPGEGDSGLVLQLIRGKAAGGDLALGITEQAHMQIGDKMGIPASYYRRLLAGDETEGALLARNVNHWLGKERTKRRMVRTMDANVRAFLSSKYRPIAHLDLVTQVVQVASNQIGASRDRNWAEGARCFDFALNPMKLDVCFVNPRWGIDLELIGTSQAGDDIYESKAFREFGPQELGDDGFYRGRQEPGTHWIFPSLRIRNSETGHGSMEVSMMLFEGACLNGSVRGASVAKVHLGREVSESELWSQETMLKLNRVIFSQIRDLTLATFKPEGLMEVARKFKGLESIKVQDVKEAIGEIVELNGMTEEIRDDILEAYYATTKQRGNLMDVQRSVTATAHAWREKSPETASRLEEIGGEILDRGLKALATV